MAGDWIKMRADLREDPTVFRIAEAIGDDDLTIVGRLFAFWAWADKHSVDGHVDGAVAKLIDRVVGKSGFAEALCAVGWLVLEDGRAVIPNFERHNGESAKERSLKNARQARWRQKKNAAVDAAPSTEASTREEKRREEENQGDEFSPGFLRFWETWPRSDRKAAKGKCFASWKKAKAEAQTDAIVSHVEGLKRSSGWQKDGGQYIPAPLVYLNERRWEGAEEASASDDPYGLRNAL